MRRVVSLYLPTWPTYRLRRRLGPDAPSPETPLVLVGRQGRKRLVVAADPAALAHRLHPGMAATQARAVVGDLVVHPFDPAGDAAALDQLALWALRPYAPIVAADPPNGLVLDVTGAGHRYGGDQGLLEDLIAQTARVGLHARAALADTWGAAHALARQVTRPTIAVKSGGPAIRPLSVHALRLPADMVDGLGGLGIDTIGELEAKPRAPLALRFGPELIRRLDQAYGRAPETITPIDVPELMQVRRVFAEPIGAPETLARYTLKLVEALSATLESQGLGATRLDLRFKRIDNRTEATHVGLARPVRNIQRLSRLLCDRIETVDPGLGVEAMVLAAPVVLPLDWSPTSGDLPGPATPYIGDLVDLLANRLGPHRLYRLAPAWSDVPEHATRRLAPTAPPVTETWAQRWPSPLRLLARPEAIEAVALLPDQPPVVLAGAASATGLKALTARSGSSRMVATRRCTRRRTRLFPAGGRGRAPLLGLPPRRRRTGPDGRSKLAAPRPLRLTAPRRWRPDEDCGVRHLPDLTLKSQKADRTARFDQEFTLLTSSKMVEIGPHQTILTKTKRTYLRTVELSEIYVR